MGAGYKPDMIVGDMDSVSDKVLRLELTLCFMHIQMAEHLVFAFAGLGLNCTVVPCEGPAKICLLILNQLGASIIITVGSHSSMIDFLRRGERAWQAPFSLDSELAIS